MKNFRHEDLLSIDRAGLLGVRLLHSSLFETAGREIKNELIFKTIGWVFVPMSGNPNLKTVTA